MTALDRRIRGQVNLGFCDRRNQDQFLEKYILRAIQTISVRARLVFASNKELKFPILYDATFVFSILAPSVVLLYTAWYFSCKESTTETLEPIVLSPKSLRLIMVPSATGR